MKYTVILSVLIISMVIESWGQASIPPPPGATEQYQKTTAKAWSLWNEGEREEALGVFEKAFVLKEEHVPLADRYNVACMYALTADSQKAFEQLFYIGKVMHWSDVDHLENDSDLNSLHQDTRWSELVALIVNNKLQEEASLDPALVKVLNEIYQEDQKMRQGLMDYEKKYGRGSEEMDAYWAQLLKKDSLNLIKVSSILDREGWPSKDKIGKRGVSTIFLVLQHADATTQSKYKNLVIQAFERGDLQGYQYAMFMDRLTLREGGYQVYGTQLAIDDKSKDPYVLPIQDVDQVDYLRSEIGLNSMQENLNRWSLIWDVEKYKEELPSIIKRMEEKSQK